MPRPAVYPIIPAILIGVVVLGILIAWLSPNNETKNLLAAKQKKVELVGCYDGDTCEFRWDGVVHTLRIVGIDAPELGARASCDKEYNLAIQARDRLRTYLRNAAIITVEPIGVDRYSRVLAFVYADGKNVVPLLIHAGLATPFASPKTWCVF